METYLLNKRKLTVLLLVIVSLLMSALSIGLTHGQALAAPAPHTATLSTTAALPASTACSSPSAGASICSLWAITGTIGLPGATVKVWGYSDSSTGSVSLPGPVLIVNEGDVVTVTLTNRLTESTALLFQGQDTIPDLTGAAANGGTKSYTFTATRPGTYLYEAGLLPNAQHQVAMGMYGALIVQSNTPGQAYSSASTAFSDEALLVLSEIDPLLNNSANPANFDMRNFRPTYALINGKAFPQTTGITSTASSTVLLRYVNAGLQAHSMSALGLRQTAIALDGSAYDFAHKMVAETIAPGQTADALVSIPSSAIDGTKYALYDATFAMHNGNTGGFGGMLTFISIGTATTGADTIGPATSGVALSPNQVSGAVGVSVSASVSDAASGGSDVTAAEYTIDTTVGTGTAMTGSWGPSPVAVNATIPAAIVGALSTGNHTVYVRGQDSAGNWGAFTSAILKVDNTGPTSSGLTLTPNPSNGTVNVALHATANDAASGGSIIAAAEYTIDGGTAAPLTVNVPASVSSLDATIPAATINGLSDGSHSVSVRSQDALGNWGTSATISLIVDKTGPTAGGVSAAPNPSNGLIGINSSTPAVRVTATFTDVLSTVSAGEGFIDTVGANGTGFIFIAVDGVFNSPIEVGRVDVPLTTIAGLSEGNHTLYAHGKDSAGNWGATSSTILVVDKTGPVISSVSAAPNPTNGAPSVTLSASTTDNLSSVVTAEWFTGADPGVGNGTPMTISGGGPFNLAASINVSGWNPGNYTLYVRARDAAGNWSSAGSTTLAVTQALYFSTAGNTNPPGVGGTADDADIYFWNGSAYSRNIDASTIGIPAGANVDGFVRVDNTHFYLSFSNTSTNLPGIGTVQDEDVVYYNNGVWSLYFDGTAHGLGTSNNLDIDAMDIVGGVLYFSTAGNTNPPGVGGTADDADIYAWDGTSYTRVWDATAAGLAGGANVDGFVRVDATHFYLSFSSTSTTLPGIGTVQDEDIVFNNNGVWSVFFDGTAYGLGTSNNLNIDAFDLP